VGPGEQQSQPANDGRFREAAAVKGDRKMISDDIVDVFPPVIAILMLAMAFLIFTYDKLFDSLTALMHLSVPAQNEIYTSWSP
jgi:hypothetical protein